jgi:hypothetical protein
MKKTMRYLLPALMLAILAAVSLRPAKAQLDIGNRIYLTENGARVGEVYVPERAAGQIEYVEEWVLFPNYRYPGPSFMGMLNIIPSATERPYSSQEDFLQNVPFPKGSKYVRVSAQEFTALPVTW